MGLVTKIVEKIRFLNETKADGFYIEDGGQRFLIKKAGRVTESKECGCRTTGKCNCNDEKTKECDCCKKKNENKIETSTPKKVVKTIIPESLFVDKKGNVYCKEHIPSNNNVNESVNPLTVAEIKSEGLNCIHCMNAIVPKIESEVKTEI